MITVALTVLWFAVRAVAQPGPSPSPPPPAPVQPSPARLDDLLAPVALYPDPLLAQVLMAASYPVEVVQADRWLADPGNAALTDGDLAAVVNQQAWDPSVKSLVPFPQILAMMDRHLDWTQDLGEAFVANPAAVMDAVQDLRRRAMVAGALRSTPNLTVSEADGVITILPAAPQEVYYPAYDPDVAYGPWPYPDNPPYAFDDAYGGCAADAFGSCWIGVAVVLPLWGWQHCDWRHHRIRIDPDRFAALNHQRPPAGGTVWVHERGHRHGVPYQNAETRARYPPAAANRAARSLSDLPTRSPPYWVGTGAGAGPVGAAHSRPPTPLYYSRAPQAPPPVERGPAPRVFAPATARPPRAAPAASARASTASSQGHSHP